MNIVSIDPSVNNIGFALLQTGLSKADVWDWGVWKTETDDNLQARCHAISVQLGELKPTQLVIEFPTFMTSLKGQVAAQKGYTIDLATVVGWLAGASGISPHDIFFYTPMQWKGQKKKHMIESRFLSIFGRGYKGTSDHAYEAVMMLHQHAKKLRYI